MLNGLIKLQLFTALNINIMNGVGLIVIVLSCKPKTHKQSDDVELFTVH